MSNIIEIIGARLRARRIELHLSQEQTAEKANLHPTYIGQVERGEKNATIESIYKICVALDYPMEHLFEKIILSAEEASSIPTECFLMISNLPLKDQETIRSIINSVISLKN